MIKKKLCLYPVIIYLFYLAFANGALESTFARCCTHGVNWARESQVCFNFPAPVPGEPTEHQSICLTSATLCCIRFYRQAQCERGKQASRNGLECLPSTDHGGEYYKDCCDGCTLGLISGNMGMECQFQTFNFGFPWNDAYKECCVGASPSGTSLETTIAGQGSNAQGGYVPGLPIPDTFPDQSEVRNIPDSENLCLLFLGQLCGHVCVPTKGSYVCECRVGFTLSVDRKSCIQDVIRDRCKVNNPCDHICHDTGVSIECSCDVGYLLTSDQRSCNDVDECSEAFGVCTHGLTCQNTIGSFTCSPINSGSCPNGFAFDVLQQICLDIDECSLRSDTCTPNEFCLNTQGGFECQVRDRPTDCPAGFKYNSQNEICEDIDECVEDADICAAIELCINSIGSYSCVAKKQPLRCDFGYRYNEDALSCVDINECREGRNLCSEDTEVCINLPGAYRCDPKYFPHEIPEVTARTTTSTHLRLTTTTIPPVATTKPLPPQCPQGYAYNSIFRSCMDADECQQQVCSRHEICNNTPGSYICSCQDGYARGRRIRDCGDVNECQLGLHTCTATQRCDNTLGSYTCTRIAGCGTGYTLNHNTGRCEDDDECELRKDDCRQLGPKWMCINTKGSFRCQRKTCPKDQILNSWGICEEVMCIEGYKPLGRKCVDMDECTEGGADCKLNERCVNSIGSYGCVPKINCGRGYEMNDIGNQCIDMDECKDNLHSCTEDQECINRPGGYVCQCPAGYRVDHARACQDIDECLSYYGSICGSNGICENTPGSYVCNCKDGFEKSHDKQTCLDIDECTRENTGGCEQNCINIWGSHYCTCNPGFKLSSNNKTCDDIDECEEYRGRGRLCIGICVNTPGTFKCSCPEGYRLLPDQKTCKDIDECDDVGRCRGDDEICVNSRGSFKCHEIRCPPNYIRDSNLRNRCKKETLCREDDTHCLQQPLTYSYNFLPLAANMTLRPRGEVDIFTMRGPLWSSTKVHFDLELESTEAPLTVMVATREFFLLRRTDFNQVVLTLVKSLDGPQEVLLNLNMKLYTNGLFGGSAVAKLLIIVSQHEF